MTDRSHPRLRNRRRLLPAVLALATALALAGCGDDEASGADADADASSASTSAAGCQDYSAGEASDAVRVPGAFGKKHDAEFDTPLTVDSLQRTIVSEGSREQPKPGEVVDTLVSVYLGKDGTSLGTESVPITVGDDAIIPAFTAAVDCVPIGSRVVVVVPAKEMYGEQGNPQLGIGADDTVVIVTDLIGIKKPVEAKPWTKDVPKVTFAEDGTPTVTLPKTEPPKDVVLKVLREGDGPVVESGDDVTVNYQGTSWKIGKIFDQSYGRGPASFNTEGVYEGFRAGLVGQKVGSRVIVSMPPEYGAGAAGSGSKLAGQSLVFVIEILKKG